eukprot:365643-Chlamydomonas_euryale.AAC.25
MIRTSHPLSNPASSAFYTRSCPGFQRRQGGIILSFWDKVHALFDEDRFKSIASRVFSGAKSSFSHNPKCSPPNLHSVLSSRTTPSRWPIRRHILGFGTRFASLWAHPLPMLILRQPFVCSSFHFARNLFGRSFWFFHSIWLATRLELALRRCLTLQTICGFVTPLALRVLL